MRTGRMLTVFRKLETPPENLEQAPPPKIWSRHPPRNLEQAPPPKKLEQAPPSKIWSRHTPPKIWSRHPPRKFGAGTPPKFGAGTPPENLEQAPPPKIWSRHPPPVDRILDTRYWKYYLGQNFVSAGNNIDISFTRCNTKTKNIHVKFKFAVFSTKVLIFSSQGNGKVNRI